MPYLGMKQLAIGVLGQVPCARSRAARGFAGFSSQRMSPAPSTNFIRSGMSSTAWPNNGTPSRVRSTSTRPSAGVNRLRSRTPPALAGSRYKIVDGMNDFVNNRLRSLSTRKEQAQLVISSYGETNRASFLFKLLDGKSLGKEEYKKLMFQVLKH